MNCTIVSKACTKIKGIVVFKHQIYISLECNKNLKQHKKTEHIALIGNLAQFTMIYKHRIKISNTVKLIKGAKSKKCRLNKKPVQTF